MAVDFTGVWQADLSDSKLLGPAPKAISVTIAHSDPELSQEIVVTKADAIVERIAFRCRTDGAPDHCSLNGVAANGTARWDGDELVIELRIQRGAGELYLCDCWSLSADTKTLIMEHRDDALAGQVTVLRRMD